MFGELEPVETGMHWAAVALAAGTIALWLRVQVVVAGLREVQGQSRWASNARDLIALAGALAVGISFRLCGLPLAAALLFSGTLGVLIELIRQNRRVFRVSAGIALALGLSVAVWPATALRGANALAHGLMLGHDRH